MAELNTRPHHRPPRDKDVHPWEILIVARHWGEHKFTLGAGAAQISDESGGWEEVERPGDVNMTIWRSAHPLRMTIPILLDGWVKGENQRSKVQLLHGLVRTDEGDRRPPVFKIYGNIPFRRHAWVMESIEYQDDPPTLYARSGALLRQALNLNVIQFVPGQDVKIRKRGKGRFHRVRHNGETCLSIAKAEFDHHIHQRAKQIARLNDIRSIRKKLKKGRLIKLPRGDGKGGDG